MMTGRKYPRSGMIGLALISSSFWASTARGDGGTLRAWRQHGDYDIAIFTEPSPFVTGPVDISVLLLDRQTGAPNREARVMVEISPAGRPAHPTRHLATEQAATNKLLRAAVFELRDPGRCNVIVHIDWPDDHAQLQFDLNAESPWSPRAGIWPWILWPVPAIVIYGIHLGLVNRSGRVVRTSDGR